MRSDSITLKSLTREDAAAVGQWPPYPAPVAALDFALRKGGWLDQFPESSQNHRYAAWHQDTLVGFSMLADLHEGNAEFYLAVHPARLGQGFGEPITRQTLHIAFKSLGLSRIHLRVRNWHERAIALYERVGFKKHGTCVAPIQGQPVHFIMMERYSDTVRG